MTDLVTAFREVMQSVYGPLDFQPVADGKIHRFHVPDDKPRSRNGWYVLHLDGIASGAFGSWKAGDSHTWSHRKPIDSREVELLTQRLEQSRRQRETEQQRRQQRAAERAERMWRGSPPADPDHPYLMVKRIKPHSLRQAGNALLIPLVNGVRLVNLQRIGPDGEKRFLAGGQVKGCYSPIGELEPGQPLLICEGWATAATLREQTGYPVAAAMNAGNLLAAGQALKDRHSDLQLIFCGDDDRRTHGNPGRTAATTAAAALDCTVAFPEWPEDALPSLTDFNDLAVWGATHG